MFPSGSVPDPGEGEEAEEEKETHRTESLPEDPSLDPSGNANPYEFRWHKNRCQKQQCGRPGEPGTEHTADFELWSEPNRGLER